VIDGAGFTVITSAMNFVVSAFDVAVTVAGGQIKIANQDVNTDVNVTANAETVLLGLTTGAASPANDRAVNSTNLLDNIVAAGGAANGCDRTLRRCG